MKRLLFIFLVNISLISIFSQTNITIEKDVLQKVTIGKEQNQIYYSVYDEGTYGPEGPFVDSEGSLIFYPSNARDHMIMFNKVWSAFPLYEYFKDATGHSIRFSSQQGFVIVGLDLFVPLKNGKDFNLHPKQKIKLPITYKYHNYPMPFGSYLESISPPYIYSSELQRDNSIIVRDFNNTQTWLLTQPGGFTIGVDGLLYKNGMLWSAVLPKEPDPAGVHFLGRLISGHTIWAGGGKSNEERYFGIANSIGQWEVTFELPWAPQRSPRELGYNPFNYGLGPWGEIYALIAPYWDEQSIWTPKDGDTSELVVVRNHLKYFGRLNIDAVRLRKEPNTTSEILGTYPAKTGFRILEKGTEEETIGGQKNVWYKVRLLDGKEGYFFGTFVHNLYDGPNGLPPPWPNVPDW